MCLLLVATGCANLKPSAAMQEPEKPDPASPDQETALQCINLFGEILRAVAPFYLDHE